MNKELPLGYIASNGVSLLPTDSLARAVELLQASSSGAVPVIEGGQLRGLVSDREIARGLSEEPDAPVANVMTRDVPIVPAGMRAEEGLKLLAGTDFPALPVVMPDGYFVGTVGRAELLTALFRRRRPASVGGMATPLGVYLSDGTFRGGASDFALMLTGVFLFFGMLVSEAFTSGVLALWARSRLPMPIPYGYVSSGLFLLAFAMWFRFSWVAGFHAAEHQTVHAIERNEPLNVESVRRMPRPHPRCGTNLMVLVSLFTTLVYELHWDAFLAGVLSLVAYRFFGYWVQLHVTTRPATRGQLENGIRAGEQLLERYQNGAAPARFEGFRRLWNMGFLQVALGNMIPWMLFGVLARYSPFVAELTRHLQ